MTMTKPPSPSPPNPRKVEAGRKNRALRRGLTDAGRDRLRQAALAGRPWESATGPKTPEGKAKSAANGKVRQVGPKSVREARSELADVRGLIAQMQTAREAVLGLLAKAGDAVGP